MTNAFTEPTNVALAKRLALVVRRENIDVPKGVAQLQKVAIGTVGVFVVGMAALFGLPELLHPIAPYVGASGVVAIVLGVVAVNTTRRNGAAVRRARDWEARFLRTHGARLLERLGAHERVLDYCAVVRGNARRYAPFGLFVLTNARLLVFVGTTRLSVDTNIALRTVHSLYAGPLGTLEDAGDFLDLKRGTGMLAIEHGVRRRLVLLFPTPGEAQTAYDVILEVQRNAPVAERGALAIAEPDGAGELALVDAPGLAVVDDEDP